MSHQRDKLSRDRIELYRRRREMSRNHSERSRIQNGASRLCDNKSHRSLEIHRFRYRSSRYQDNTLHQSYDE
jgi:hypothetical protein